MTKTIRKKNQLQQLLFAGTLFTIALLGGITAFFIFRGFAQYGFGPLGITAPKFLESLAGSSPQSGDEASLLESGNNETDTMIAAPDLTPWDGAGRVTILILGLDSRDWEAGEKYSRSDTMILLTLDPLTNSAGILSIPRDMWVAIPGFKHSKINTAYYLGESNKMPGGGPGLAVKAAEQFLGVPINYYAQIDFGAFVSFIDEIGGVKIDVPERITVDLLGGGADTKKTLKPGVQVLPGEWALAYARNRSTGGGDFDRAQRQQQVILAIRDRILSLQMLPRLITRAPALYSELASGINTNLTVDQAIKLALLAQEVKDNDIQRGVIDEEYIIFGRSPDNLSILIPIPDKIRTLRDKIFALSSGLSPETSGDDKGRIQAEAANLAIFNASQAPGVAGRTGEYLRAQGVIVAEVVENSELRAATRIIDHSGNPYLLKYLVDLMGISSDNIYIELDLENPVDIEIYLGNNWANNNPIP